MQSKSQLCSDGFQLPAYILAIHQRKCHTLITHDPPHPACEIGSTQVVPRLSGTVCMTCHVASSLSTRRCEKLLRSMATGFRGSSIPLLNRPRIRLQASAVLWSSEVRLTVEYAAGLALWETTCRQATEISGLAFARLMALEHCLEDHLPSSHGDLWSSLCQADGARALLVIISASIARLRIWQVPRPRFEDSE